MKEPVGLGTGGALHYFRQEILCENENNNETSEKLKYFYVMHADICCTFPLKELAICHERIRPVPAVATLLTTKV